MTDTHAHGPIDTRPYIVVFVALCIFTAISFIMNGFVRGIDALHIPAGTVAAGTAFVVILGVAVVKAICVATYFMHLKWDWNRLYFIIIPALVLAPMLVFALLPDLVIYWSNLLGPETPLPPR
ncbi:MAG TPA: cytochrome C oxidase subunit IV family protein [Gemmataceae bacterium]|nr:cytochrome C oxidase subunit IV family protein [Gemmataceae bacterium]